MRLMVNMKNVLLQRASSGVGRKTTHETAMKLHNLKVAVLALLTLVPVFNEYIVYALHSWMWPSLPAVIGR